MTRPLLPLILLLTATLCGSQTAFAQSQDSRRPTGALFGTRAPDGARAQQMDFTFSLHGAYDDNALGRDNGAGDPRFQRSGVYTGLTAALTYSKRHEAFSFGADASTGLRYLSDIEEVFVTQQRAGLSLGIGSGRTKLQAKQTFAFSPNYALQFFPGASNVSETDAVSAPEIGGADFLLVSRQTYRSQTGVTVSRQLDRRSSIGVSYGFGFTAFPKDAAQEDMSVQSHRAGIRYQRNVTQYSSLRLGYAATAFQVASGSTRTLNHNVDAGVDYRRPLSFSRRTHVTFGSGSSIVQHNDSTHLRLSGSADLQHEMGRTWTTGLSYRRGVGMIDGFAEPTFADTANAVLSGFLSRRLDLTAMAGYSSGAFGFSSVRSGYETYVGTVRLRFALSRTFAVYSEYLYYRYSFGDGVRLPPGIGRELDRQGVRAGLMASLPIF